MITIEEMEIMLDEIAAELPDVFFKELNGGIILLPQTKRHYKRKADDLYIMGEYHRNGNMGRYISIYYGSYIKVYGHLPNERIKEQLRSTLRHEFRHHMESLGGERDLEAEDEQYIAEYLKKHGGKK